MPEYEYHCRNCKKLFTLHLTMSEYAKAAQVKCPSCGSTDIEQMLPDVMVITSKKS